MSLDIIQHHVFLALKLLIFLLVLANLFLLLKIIIISRRNALSILSQIKSQEIGVRNFLNRCSRVLPPFLDNLDIGFVLDVQPEAIEKLFDA